MKAMTAKWGAMVVLAGLLACMPEVEAQPPEKNLFRTELPLKTPRSRDPVLGGSRDKVFFSVRIPDGVRTVRGAVCNPFSKDAGVSKHWQAACRQWQFAYVQTDFDAVKKEEFALLQTALAELAKKSGHPEIEHMPLCFTGMSRGSGMSMQLAELMPERTLASVPVCLEVGPSSEATRRIPVLTVFGEKDGKQMQLLREKLPSARKEQAHWAIAVQWGRGHEFGQANNLSFVFLDDVIARRLPKEPGVEKPAALGPFPLEEGWVGDPSTWGKDGKRPTIHAWKDFKGEGDQVCWLPSQRVAAVWQAFVGATREVTLTEPAGLGDGQPFVLHSATQPVAVKVTLAVNVKPEKVELWDAHQRLAERTEAPWSFEVSIKPGIHALIVTAQEAGQPLRTSRPHTIVVAE
jgi:dienelactone hydrolase